MKRAIYPGSFDPVTKGHLDIIERAAAIVDELIVGVLNNNIKTPLFSVEERVSMLISATRHISNVQVEAFSGLSVDFVEKCDASFIVRGLRAVTDFEYELQMAHTNRVMAPDIDTIFLTTNLNYSYVSSTIVKEIASFDGNLEAFLHPDIADMVKRKARKGIDRK